MTQTFPRVDLSQKRLVKFLSYPNEVHTWLQGHVPLLYGWYIPVSPRFAKNSVELSVAEKIWLLIVEVINIIIIAEVLNCGAMALTEQVISNDKQIKAVKEAFDKLTIAA